MYKKSTIWRKIAVLAFGAVWIQSASAQQAGEVTDQEFVIRKDRVLTLPKQPRKFERVPVLPTPKSNTTFNYQVQPYLLSLEPEVIRPEAAQRQWPRVREELYPGFVRLGFGNYSSPLLEARFNNWEEGDYNFGAAIKHEGFYRGPVDGRNSAENFTNVAIDGNLYQELFQVYAGLEYDRHGLNFYGYDPENPFLSEFIPGNNILNTFKLKAGIQNIEKMDGFNYNALFAIRGFNDKYEAAENEVAMDINTDFWFDDYLKTAIDLELSLTRPRDINYSNINRNYFKVNPYVGYQRGGLFLKAGANIVLENDVTLNKNSDFHIFPQVTGLYMLQEEFGVYVGFEGDVIRNTYLDFVNENPFLGPSDRLLNTIQNYQAKAGVKGVLNDELTYEAGVSLGQYRNMHFFGNSPVDSLRFNVIYDDNTRVINYNTKVGWQHEGWYRLIAAANYYHYTTTSLQAAFQRPEWELTLNNNFTPADAWLIQLNANVMGGIQGYNFQTERGETLPAIIDIQTKIDYQITDRISVFGIGNNLLNRRNQRFLNYPVRGIQGIVGVTMKF